MIRILNEDGQPLAEIEGDSLRNAMLANKYLKGAQLAGQDLTGANLDDANLSQANLSGAILEGASLENTNLSEVDLSKSKLDNAKLQRADLTKANMEQATAVSATFVDVNFSDTLARGCNFNDAELCSKDEAWFSMRTADFSNSTFDRAFVSRADVTKTCFFGTDFSKCSGLMMVTETYQNGTQSTAFYPTGLRFSYLIGFEKFLANPCFDHETRWPSHITFPRAKIPWFRISKFAAISFGAFWITAGLADESFGTSIASSSPILTIVILLSIGLPFAWFFKRTIDINAEIDREPSLHYGKYADSRSDYQLGERMGEQERENCLGIRKY